MYRTLIIDDERIARDGLRDMLGAHAELTVVGESSGGRQAIVAMRTLSPDVLFLDVRMPDLDGFDVLAEVDGRHGPAVVFVSAYRDHAVEAFGYAAVDYLLKPFTRDRLAVAVRRVTHHLRYTGHSGDAALTRLVVRDGGLLRFVEPRTVQWFEGFGNYVRLAVDGRYLVLRGTLGRLAARLDRTTFVRISRSVIVNLQHVRAAEPLVNGQFALHMASRSVLRSSRRYRRDVGTALKAV
jgi:two-component system LytT family response regulator